MPKKNRTTAQLHTEAWTALRLHNQGLTQEQIASKMTEDGMPISQPTVSRRIQLGLELYVVPGLAEAQKQALSKLDSLLEALAPAIARGDVNAIKTAVSIETRRAAILGLDKPRENQPAQPVVNPLAGLVEQAKLRVVNGGQN